MSWADLILPARKTHVVAAVVASCNKAGGRFGQALRLTIRPDLIEGGLAWWKPDAWVRVQIGDGAEAGMLRLSPGTNARFRLRKSGGQGGLAVLALQGFKLGSTAVHKNTALEFDHGSDWLELTLPGWARTGETIATAEASSKAPPNGKKPFVGLGSQSHVDLHRGRTGSGPIPLGGRS